jgi:GTPase
LNTLAPLRQRIHVMGGKGRNGLGKARDGQKGRSLAIPVPPGTIIRELRTQKLAGELRKHGDRILVARGGRGGRGNKAFMTERNTAPKLSERGEPGAKRWLSVELRLVADVGFLGKPNAGKSTLLAAASAARPKIANYPFTTIVPNLGVCDIGDEGAGLILCDIPGLIEGAAQGAGLGPAFLRHVQRCRVLLHVVDGTSEDPIGDFNTINKELKDYDSFLAEKPQVVVLNKIDVSEVQEQEEQLLEELQKAAGHSRVLSISAATTANVKELMGRLKKFVEAQPESELPPIPEINLGLAGLDFDSDDYEIISDPSYPGQWRITGEYIENTAKMTHWEYPEAVARFGRQLEALGIAKELQSRGAMDGDLVMVGKYDFEFNPGMSNPYIPQELLEKDARMEAIRNGKKVDEGDDDLDMAWRPFNQGGFLDVDVDELVGFSESDDWELLDDDFDEDFELEEDDEDSWTYSE